MTQFVSVTDFGAKGDGSTDDSLAFQRAVDSNPSTMYVPDGTYIVNNVDIRNSLAITGSGMFSTIKPNQQNADVFRIKTRFPVYFSYLNFQSFSQQIAGSYISVPSDGVNFNDGSSFDNITMGGAFKGIDFIAASRWSVCRSYFAGYKEAGVSVANNIEPDAGDSTIEASVFDAGTSGGIAVMQWSSGGLRIINNKFLSGPYHYLGQFNTSPRMTSILLIQGNSFEHATGALIALNSINADFSCVLIDSNHFTVPNGSNGILFQEPVSKRKYLYGATISGNFFNLGGPAASAMRLNAGDQILISPNNIIGTGTAMTFGQNVGKVTAFTQMFPSTVTKYSGTITNVKFV